MRKFATVRQEKQPDLSRWHQSHIRRRIIETARFVDDVEFAEIYIFPSHRLSELLVKMECLALGHSQGLAQLWIGHVAVDARGHQGDEVPRGGEHLSGARKVEIALLVSGRTNRCALVGITLDGFL